MRQRVRLVQPEDRRRLVSLPSVANLDIAKLRTAYGSALAFRSVCGYLIAERFLVALWADSGRVGGDCFTVWKSGSR